MGTTKLITGVWAALRTPRTASGAIDEGAFEAQLEFLLQHGIRGVVLNGATGEYALTSPAELQRLLALTASRMAGRGEFLCGIGAAGIHDCVAAGETALQAGAKALLLPMPHFFPYTQDDLREFCRTAAASLPAPILLYNLPHFTTPLETATAVSLIAETSNIAGIKDSSGSLEIVRSLPETACRIIGDDSALVAALEAGVCDGVISGVANVMPELLTRVFHGPEQADAARLHEFIEHLSVFPTPWGLKLAAECRGLGAAHFEQPLSSQRREQADAFRCWFSGWLSA